MTLIETHPGETDAEVRSATDAILQTFNPSKTNWWHAYELRGAHRRGDKVYREFYCIAGSVQIWLWKMAKKRATREVIWIGSDGQPINLNQ